VTPARAGLRWGALAVGAALAIAACSDDGGSDGDRADRAAASSTTTSIVFTGDAGSPFCGVLEDLGSDTVLSEPSESAQEVEAAYTRLLEVLQRAADAAPPEVEPDVGLLLEGIAALDDALRAVGYDYEALSSSPEGPAVSAAVNDPSFAVAGDRLQAYKHQVCGL
jgi:hypothetical protein